MAGMNKVILIGNVGQAPEITTANSGMIIAKLSLATSDGMKDRETGYPKTEWHRLICFKQTAEIVQKYVKKGSTIAIEGSIQYGKYDNKDGITVYTTDIIANRLTLLDKKADNNPQNQQQQQQQQAPKQFNIQDGEIDLPF